MTQSRTSGRKVFDTTIPAAGTTSAEVDLDSFDLVGVIVPAVWTAADLTFQVKAGDEAFADLYSSAGVAITASVAAEKYHALDPVLFAGADEVRVVSSETQAADRVIKLVLRALV